MSIQFDPVPVRRSRRGPDRAAILAVGLIAFLAVAFLKPWRPFAASAPAPTQPAVDALSSPGPEPSGAAPLAIAPQRTVGLGTPAAPSGLRRPSIVGRLVPRGALGLTIVSAAGLPFGAISSEGTVGSAIDPGIVVAWLRQPPSGEPIVVERAPDRPILALGVTAPPHRPLLDLRFWRLNTNDPPQRLTAPDLPGDQAAGDRLFLPPLEDRPAPGWLPGTYLVELLDGEGVRTLAFELRAAGSASD